MNETNEEIFRYMEDAYHKLDEARIWARRQMFLLGTGLFAALTAHNIVNELTSVLWAMAVLCVVVTVAIEITKYMDADNSSNWSHVAAHELKDFVDGNVQDGINS